MAAKRLDTLLSVILLGVILGFFGGFASIATADDVYKVIVKKQETKEKYRWSIDNWLKRRDKMRLMDLWLKLHSPSPYEFYIGGEYQMARFRGASDFNAKAFRAYFAAYASIFGIEVQKEFRVAHWLAMFHIRVFGYHAQGTNITFQGGLRSVDNPETYRNPFVGVSFTVNFTKYAGIEAWYRYYLGSLSNVNNIRTTGNRIEANLFIDFKFFRIYAGSFQETEHIHAGVVNQDNNRWGFHIGNRLYF